MSQFDDMQQDANVLPANEQLAQLANLAQEQVAKEKEIEDLEVLVSQKKEELRQIAEVKLPEIFTALNLESFTLKDGTKIECKPFYAGNISEQNAVAAFKWLRDNEHGDLIKHEIKAQFGRGEDEQCAKLKETLQSLDLNYTDKESVHHSTLKAFIKDQIENGAQGFPMDLFSVHIGKKAKVKLPKIKGGR